MLKGWLIFASFVMLTHCNAGRKGGACLRNLAVDEIAPPLRIDGELTIILRIVPSLRLWTGRLCAIAAQKLVFGRFRSAATQAAVP